VAVVVELLVMMGMTTLLLLPVWQMHHCCSLVQAAAPALVHLPGLCLPAATEPASAAYGCGASGLPPE
jgi:hypothetical protein